MKNLHTENPEIFQNLEFESLNKLDTQIIARQD